MGKLILLIALAPALATLGAAMANDLPKSLPKNLLKDLPKNTQPKPKAPLTTANPCAQHGPGFVQVQGTTTCVRMNGYVRTDGATSGRPR
jgi:hypothetical protein